MSKIQFITPHQCGNELKYVSDATLSNWIAPLGPYVNEMEKNLRLYTKTKQCVLVNSGTSALHLAFKMAGVTKGDIVLCTDVTFIASILGAIYEGATPLFLETDSDMVTNIDALEIAIKKYGKKIKAMVVTHLYGYADKNIFKIKEICEKHKIILIEDAAETLGTTIESKMTGTIGDYGVYSFNGNKIITTSGGGALVSNKHSLKHALHLATQARDSKIDYIHSLIGYNYRLSNVSAALGLAQLETIEKKITLKRYIYEFYQEGFKDFEQIKMLPIPPNVVPNYWVSIATVEGDSHKLVEYLLKHDIEARLIWRPLHTQPVFINSEYIGFGNSMKVYHSTICLPSDINMTLIQQQFVIDKIKEFYVKNM